MSSPQKESAARPGSASQNQKNGHTEIAQQQSARNDNPCSDELSPPPDQLANYLIRHHLHALNGAMELAVVRSLSKVAGPLAAHQVYVLRQIWARIQRGAA
jgi:hypothetical protein